MSIEGDALAMVVDRLLHDERMRPLLDTILGGFEQPTGLVDQIDAAQGDATRFLDRLGPAEQVGLAPAWVRMAAVKALTNWAIGDVRVCVHRPHPDRPEPVYAAVSVPGVITCQRCMNLLLFSVDLRHCDQCQETTTRLCLTGMMQISALTLLFLVCHACAAKLQQDEKPDGKPPAE